MLAAEIITISDKLLTPFYSDTNTLWLTEQLNNLGIDVKLKAALGDDQERITFCLKNALSRSQIIVVLLSPTESSLTYQIVAQLLNQPLVNNSPNVVDIVGAQKIANPENELVGMVISDNDKRIILLPNVLSQLQTMFAEVLPLLAKLVTPIYLRRRLLKVVGLSESAIDAKIAPIYTQYQTLTTMILFFQNEVHIRLVASAPSEDEAEEVLNEVVSKIAAELGKNLFTYQNENLEDVVAKGLASRNYTIAITENGSGGLLASRLSNHPASQLCLKQGNICSYSAQSSIEVIDKEGKLTTISEFISAAAAQALAVDAKQRAASTIGISITGIVDKDLASPVSPVGLFFIGLADNTKITSQKLLLPPGDRERLRGLSSAIALDLIRRKYCCD